MILVRLSSWYELILVASFVSVFVDMIHVQNLISVLVHPGCCTGSRFSFWYENLFSYRKRGMAVLLHSLPIPFQNEAHTAIKTIYILQTRYKFFISHRDECRAGSCKHPHRQRRIMRNVIYFPKQSCASQRCVFTVYSRLLYYQDLNC